jgi:hypothetical protein
MRYYFDTLPRHPQPKPLESLTSYLMRLAQANHICRPQAVFRLFWDRSHMERPSDYLPLSFGRLPLAAACSEAELRRTTFYHLGKKFNCSIHPRPLGRFLSGCLSRSLRYCPQCVAEHSCYFLPWRFLHLPGCMDHGCRFLERCSHCGHILPLFWAPLKIGICPLCKGDLRMPAADPLTRSEWSVARVRSSDIAFLLTPHPWEATIADVLAALGWQFARRRQKTRLRQVDVDVQLGYPLHTTQYIEHGAIMGNDSKLYPHLPFPRYLTYAEFLGAPLSELFTEALAQLSGDKIPGQLQARQTLNQMGEDHQGRGVSEAVGAREKAEQAISRHTHEEKIGLPSEKCSNSVDLNVQLSDGEAAKPRDRREQELLNKVRLAYEVLLASGQLVTLEAIRQSVAVSRTKLRWYSQVNAFLALVVQDEKSQVLLRKAQVHEQALAAEVQHAIERLKTSGQPVTQAAIATAVHSSINKLRSYPSVRIILDEISGEEKHTRPKRREEELLKQLEEAIQLLKSRGQVVTNQALKEILHFSVASFASYYPWLRIRWHQVLAERASLQKAQRQQRREQLSDKHGD